MSVTALSGTDLVINVENDSSTLSRKYYQSQFTIDYTLYPDGVSANYSQMQLGFHDAYSMSDNTWNTNG